MGYVRSNGGLSTPASSSIENANLKMDTEIFAYATVFHELCHWRGHPNRLNRVLSSRRDIEAYAYEELVAEIGTAFLCAHCGLPARLEHASYIDNWLDALSRDKRLIFVAAGAAQKAMDFVLGSSAEAEAATVLAVIGKRIPLIVILSKHFYLCLCIHS
jgi:antirestriction protein ArdC